MSLDKINKPSMASYKVSIMRVPEDSTVHKNAYSLVLTSWVVIEYVVSEVLSDLSGIKDAISAEILIGSMDFRNKLNKIKTLAKIQGKLSDERLDRLANLIEAMEGPREIRNKICHLPYIGCHVSDQDVFFLMPMRSDMTKERTYAYRLKYSELSKFRKFVPEAVQELLSIFDMPALSMFSTSSGSQPTPPALSKS